MTCGRPVDPADAIVVRVGDDQVAVRRDRHAVRRVELRPGGRPVVAGEAARSRCRRPVTTFDAPIDQVDDVVVRIGEVDVAVRGATAMPPGVSSQAEIVGPACRRCRSSAPITQRDVRRLAQHERAGADADDHDDEDDGAAQAVACGPATARSAARAAGPERITIICRRRATRSIARRDDRGRLRRPPDGERDDRQRERRRDRAGQRPPQRQPGDGRDQQHQRRAPSALTTPKLVGRRCVLTRKQALAGAVILDQRADVEPGPAADEDADVAIVRPSVVDLDGAHRARPPQPVGQLVEDALGRGPRLGPEAILGDGAGDQQQRAPRFGERRPRPAAGLRPLRAAARPPAATARRGCGRGRGRAAG